LKIVLSVDIGTSSLKAAFIDIDKRNGGEKKPAGERLIAHSRIDYSSLALSEKGEVSVWEKSFKAALALLTKQINAAHSAVHAVHGAVHIEAICISGNGPTLVPLLKNGAVLKPIYWFDKSKKLDAQSFFLPYLAWYKEQNPRAYQETAYFFSSQEWFAYRLGAKEATVLPNLAYQPYYWDDAQCEMAGIDIKKFPPFALMGEIIGRTSKKSHAAFGLRENIPIVAGGPDFVSAILGTGTVEPGLVCDRAGSSEGINVCFARDEKGERIIQKIISEKLPIRVMPHPIEGLWNAGVVIPDSGSSIRFMLPDMSEIKIEEKAVAEKVKSAIKTLEKAGFVFNEMRLSGGQARNRQWTKLKEQYIGKKLIECEILDAELCGNAACAMFALGSAPSLREASKMMTC